MSHIHHEYYHVVSNTDENSSDFDSVGRIPYVRANLVEKTRTSRQEHKCVSLPNVFFNKYDLFDELHIRIIEIFSWTVMDIAT